MRIRRKDAGFATYWLAGFDDHTVMCNSGALYTHKESDVRLSCPDSCYHDIRAPLLYTWAFQLEPEKDKQ